ncbi:MAG: flagellin [Chitinivibrionia bacterium]|nr:flagellin [Chitinivibrionia bacterium]
MRINHNSPATVTQGALAINNRGLVKNLERLSTGLRVNRASDDAAGLAISEGLRTQIRGSQQAKRNALDGISALNIAEGATNEISAILQRQRELAIQAATATYSSVERQYMELEFQQLTSEILRISRATNFNGMKLLDVDNLQRLGGDLNKELWIDANDTSGIDSINIPLNPLDITQYPGHPNFQNAANPGAANGVNGHWQTWIDALATGAEPDLSMDLTQIPPVLNNQDYSNYLESLMGFAGTVVNADFAQRTIGTLDELIKQVNDLRADVGSFVNRLESTVNNLDISITNQAAAESQIRDADFALQSSEFSRSQILTQSATAMLAQANQVPQNVLSLIR